MPGDRAPQQRRRAPEAARPLRLPGSLRLASRDRPPPPRPLDEGSRDLHSSLDSSLLWYLLRAPAILHGLRYLGTTTGGRCRSPSRASRAGGPRRAVCPELSPIAAAGQQRGGLRSCTVVSGRGSLGHRRRFPAQLRRSFLDERTVETPAVPGFGRLPAPCDAVRALGHLASARRVDRRRGTRRPTPVPGFLGTALRAAVLVRAAWSAGRLLACG